MRCLVIGGDGMIGSALTRYLQELHHEVWATTRRTPAKQRPRVDLLQRNWDDLPDSVDVVFFCAGLTPAACEADPVSARRVMVDAPCALADRYPDASIVKLSSNAVFNGRLPHARESDGHSPVNLYGALHSEADKLLMLRAAIVRFAKIVGPNSPAFLGQWVLDLESGKAVTAISDIVFAPTTLPYLVQILSTIGMAEAHGVFQVSGASDYSYAEFAKCLSALMPDSQDILSRTSTEAGLPPPLYRHTTLDMSRVAETFGFAPQEISATISYVCAGD